MPGAKIFKLSMSTKDYRLSHGNKLFKLNAPKMTFKRGIIKIFTFIKGVI